MKPILEIFHRSRVTSLLVWFSFITLTGCSTGILKKAPKLSPSEKLQVYETHLIESPGDDSLRLEAAEFAIQTGDTLAWLKFVKPLAEQDGNETMRERFLALADSSGSLEMYRDMLELNLRRKGDRNYILRKLSEANRAIRKSETLFQTGLNAIEHGDWSRAFSSFHEAKNLYQGNKVYRAFHQLAQAELMIRKQGAIAREQAFKSVSIAKRWLPDSPMPYWVEGDIYLRLDEKEKAVTPFRESLERGVKPPFSLQARAIAGTVNEPHQP